MASKLKLEYIDCLRGVAILMVITVHTSQAFANLHIIPAVASCGRLGVQLFFVLSAYTLSLSLNNRNDGIKKFYIRRYFRIAPLYYTGILIYYLFSKISISNFDSMLSKFGSFTGMNVLLNALLLNGLSPLANNSVVPGGWSIGTEILFYLIFPLIFTLYSKIVNKMWYYIIPVFFLTISYAFQWLYLHYGWDMISDEFGYTNLFNQLPVFLSGTSLYFLTSNLTSKESKVSSALFFVLFFIIFGGSCIISNKMLNHISPLIPFMASVSFTFVFLLFKNTSWLNIKPLAYIGKLSFSLYIIHFIFSWLVSPYINLKLALNPYLSFFVCLLATILLSILVASITYRFIEMPGINLGKKLLNSSKKHKLTADQTN